MPAPVDVGRWGLSAGRTYSSGAFHGAWDIPCPTGTILRAAMGGTVIGCNRGVPKNKTGGSGAPSNWILIYTPPFPGFPQGVTTYYQHLWTLAPEVQVGAKIEGGQTIGKTDNTGNSSGPHLHIHIMYGRQSRYALYSNSKLAVYPPKKAWQAWDKAQAKPAPAAVPASAKRNLRANPVRPGEKSLATARLKSWLLGKKYNGKPSKYGPVLKRRIKKLQRKYNLGAPNGVVGPKTWAAIKSGKR
jgi:murein DD-endopeptidase MepM/ murein hydrolase activator NlpD